MECDEDDVKADICDEIRWKREAILFGGFPAEDFATYEG